MNQTIYIVNYYVNKGCLFLCCGFCFVLFVFCLFVCFLMEWVGVFLVGFFFFFFFFLQN